MAPTPHSPHTQHSNVNQSATSFTTAEDSINSCPQSSLSGTALTSQSSARKSGHAGGRSLTLLGKLPKDFSALIRSQSTSNRPQKSFHETDTGLKPLHKGYADRPSFAADIRPTPEMLCAASEDTNERPARKIKTTDRLYEFLTRSRSRSRSKAEHPSPLSQSSLPVSQHPQSHADAAPRSTQPTPTPTTSGAHPATRAQSRPVSSTTTATNATVTPGTIRAKKQPLASLPLQAQFSNGTRNENPPINFPTSSKPISAKKKKKLHNLFGFSLPSSRRSSFSSRPATPAPALISEDEPSGQADQMVFTAEPTPLSRPQTPSLPTPSATTSSQGASAVAPSKPTRSSSSASSRLDQFFRSQKLFSAKSTSSTLTKNSQSSNPSSTTAASTLVSAPLKPITSTQPQPRTGQSPQVPSSSVMPSTTVHSPSVPKQPQQPQPQRQQQQQQHPQRGYEMTAGEAPIQAPPKIIHTPASPIRSTASPSSARFKENSPPDAGQIFRIAVTEDDKRAVYRMGLTSSSPSRLREKEKAVMLGGSPQRPGPAVPVGAGATSMSSRAIKHGSFDFERPGLNPSMARSGSTGTTPQTCGTGTAPAASASAPTSTPMTNGGVGPAIRSGENLNLVRESATTGAGIAGIGTLQREVSLKRAKEEEVRKPGEDEGRLYRRRQSVHPPGSQQQQVSHPPLSGPFGAAMDPVNGSTSTSGTSVTKDSGKSGSWGRSAGKRPNHSPLRTGGTLHHGLFSFENTMLSPTLGTSGARAADGPNLSRSESTRGREQRETSENVQRGVVSVGQKPVMSSSNASHTILVAPSPFRGGPGGGDRSPVPVPSPKSISISNFSTPSPSPPLPPPISASPLTPLYSQSTPSTPRREHAGHRSGVKGRSLDLNLGLSWAPTKLREDALLPSSTFIRSWSNTSSLGSPSTPTSPNGGLLGNVNGFGKRSPAGSHGNSGGLSPQQQQQKGTTIGIHARSHSGSGGASRERHNPAGGVSGSLGPGARKGLYGLGSSVGNGSSALLSRRMGDVKGGLREANEAERVKVGREIAEMFSSVLDRERYNAFRHYVHRFDAHDIPFEGPNGIVALVDRLLHEAGVVDEKRNDLVQGFVRVVLQNN